MLISGDTPEVGKPEGRTRIGRSIASGIALLDTSAQEEVQYEAQIDHLRHSRFIGLRDDKRAKDVHRE
jgi:hypothetical protein